MMALRLPIHLANQVPAKKRPSENIWNISRECWRKYTHENCRWLRPVTFVTAQGQFDNVSCNRRIKNLRNRLKFNVAPCAPARGCRHLVRERGGANRLDGKISIKRVIKGSEKPCGLLV